VKAENVMASSHYTGTGKLIINQVYLIDHENMLPVEDGEYAYGLKIGHPF
jgi:hypothetical protein